MNFDTSEMDKLGNGLTHCESIFRYSLSFTLRRSISLNDTASTALGALNPISCVQLYIHPEHTLVNSAFAVYIAH